METVKDNVILEPTEGKPVPAMETISDEAILGATEGKFFDTVEPSMETSRDEVILGATEGKFFDTAEPGMETARGEAILEPTEGKYFDSPTAADEREMIDTVPLPERPETISSQTAEGDPAAIGTWPTPQRTVDGVEIDPDRPMDDLDALSQDEELLPLQEGTDLEPPANVFEDGEVELKKKETLGKAFCRLIGILIRMRMAMISSWMGTENPSKARLLSMNIMGKSISLTPAMPRQLMKQAR